MAIDLSIERRLLKAIAIKKKHVNPRSRCLAQCGESINCIGAFFPEMYLSLLGFAVCDIFLFFYFILNHNILHEKVNALFDIAIY